MTAASRHAAVGRHFFGAPMGESTVGASITGSRESKRRALAVEPICTRAAAAVG